MSSPFVWAIFSTLPNSPKCAVPTRNTTPTSGLAISHNAAISPRWRAPISRMQYFVSGVHSRRVIGAPSSLLKDAFVETHCARLESIDASKSLVVVFPLEPVIAITFRSGNSLRTYAASARTASSTSVTITPLPLTSRVVINPEAPCDCAFSVKSCPSEFSPTSAKKSEPLTASRESKTGADVITWEESP